MFLNIKISKASPERALRYATDKNLLSTVKARNLITEKDPAQEMRETAMRYGKWKTSKERKTVSLVISPNPVDNPTEAQVMEVTEAVLDHFFSNVQGIIVLHRDKGKDSQKANPVLHSHFYGSVIDPTTGKNIHLSDSDLRKIRAWADEWANRRYNWKPFRRGTRKAGKTYKKSLMKRMTNRGKTGWLDKLRTDVNEAFTSASSFNAFCAKLRDKGITIYKEEETNALKFELLMKGKRYQVNAKTLGDNIDWDKLQQNSINGNRRNENAGFKRTREKTETQTHMGKTGTSGYSPVFTGAGENSGQGYIGKYRIDYSCIFCTKDKDICKKCSEYYHREGDFSHGARSR